MSVDGSFSRINKKARIILFESHSTKLMEFTVNIAKVVSNPLTSELCTLCLGFIFARILKVARNISVNFI